MGVKKGMTRVKKKVSLSQHDGEEKEKAYDVGGVCNAEERREGLR
jgi:hypothetical protein